MSKYGEYGNCAAISGMGLDWLRAVSWSDTVQLATILHSSARSAGTVSHPGCPVRFATEEEERLRRTEAAGGVVLS